MDEQIKNLVKIMIYCGYICLLLTNHRKKNTNKLSFVPTMSKEQQEQIHNLYQLS